MFIRENKIFRTVFSSFIAVSYLFVVLFSAELHNHNTDIFKDLSFKKSELKITKSTQDKQSSGDCLSCHFVAMGNSLLPEQFTFHFENYTREVRTMISVQEKIWSQTKFSFQLRRPPTIAWFRFLSNQLRIFFLEQSLLFLISISLIWAALSVFRSRFFLSLRIQFQNL